MISENRAGNTAAQRQAASWNWSLVVGTVLVFLVILTVIFGPVAAPQDPMQTSYVATYQGRYIRPPFPPGVEGYPLGSDEIGRDILSRILWGIRPTMLLVLVVAAGRLSLGILAGILAGWSGGRLARVLDAVISNALAVPVLFAALCVIAALANRWGVWAFILGLLLTGWAESARLVQGQARLVKAMPFVEAARAMGANSAQSILSHVIPHIMPLMWIQMAFEVSSSLLTTAALGFLGYFVNAVWVPTDSDFVALRASGSPELGQMLGISMRQPLTAVFAGSAVFLIVLAFNLLGEGLRVNLDPERRRRRVEPSQGFGRAGEWIGDRVYVAAGQWRRTAAVGGVFALLFFILFGGSWALWRAQHNRIAESAIVIPGGNLWPAEQHDAQGTNWTSARGPTEAALAWTYAAPGELVGGPAVDSNGDLYLTVKGSRLLILDPGGEKTRIIDLPAEPVGWPALSGEGNIIVADERGSLSAFNSEGDWLWEYTGDPPDALIASPVVGPSGIVYFLTQNFIVAVTPEGERLWQILLPTYSYTSPLPRLSPDGRYLFFEDYVINAETGATVFEESIGPSDKYLVGADGKVYFRTIDSFMEWQETQTGAVMRVSARLDTNAIGAGQRFPFDAGVSPSSNPWLLYSSGFEFIRMVWTDPQGNAPQVIDFPYRRGRLVGMDAVGTAYICGILEQAREVECRAVQLSTGAILWKTMVKSGKQPVGGAITEGRLYVALQDGQVVAIGK